MATHRSRRVLKPVPTSPVPASRATWSGRLSVGSIGVPVKAYSAVATKSGSALHQVHAECGERIEHRKTCHTHGEVASDQIVKAYSYAPDDDLELTAVDLARLTDVDDETIRVDHIAPAAYVDLGLLSGRTLWLIPAHLAAAADYALVVGYLAQADKWAIGSVVFSDHRQPVAIHTVDERLILHVLHWPAQRRSYPAFGQVGGKPNGCDVRALEKSLGELRRGFSWDEYADDFERRLSEMIRDKVAARTRSSITIAGAPKIRQERKDPTAVSAAKPRRSRAA